MSDPLAYLTFDEVIADHPKNLAILFKIDYLEVWIPRSLISNDFERDNILEVPWWMVKEKGLEEYAVPIYEP